LEEVCEKEKGEMVMRKHYQHLVSRKKKRKSKSTELSNVSSLSIKTACILFTAESSAPGTQLSTHISRKKKYLE
jgi:hypothetical protein